MTARYILLAAITCCLFCIPAYAQFERTYKPIKSNGEVPEIFLENRSEAISRDLNKVQRSVNLSKKEGTEFLATNNYVMRSSFQSGRVLFNDKITTYLNQVAQRIIDANPEYAGSTHLFTARVSVPNAVSMSNGLILFNMGLLARLETESQLAFILAHEMSHVHKQHTLKKFKYASKQAKSAKKGSGRSRGRSFGSGSLDLNKIFKQYRYSRELEVEADLLGLQYLENSPYRAADAISALEILDYVDFDPYGVLPAQELFNPSSLLSVPEKKAKETKTVNPNQKFIAFKDNDSKLVTVEEEEEKEETEGGKKSKKDRKKEEEEDEEEFSSEELLEKAIRDSMRTHPIISKRVEKLREKLSAVDKGDSFIGSPIDFINIRTMARFEIPGTHFASANYFRAFYESVQLLNEYPDNEYLKKMVCKSAFWYTMIECDYTKDVLTPDRKYYEDQAYADFIHYFDHLGNQARKNWCLDLLEVYSKNNPNNNDIKFILAQAYDKFGEDEKALSVYKEIKSQMPATYKVFIQDKIDNL